jgi:anaerobic magnesium-protoporphyrin IX monomethyl ester cyclase
MHFDSGGGVSQEKAAEKYWMDSLSAYHFDSMEKPRKMHSIEILVKRTQAAYAGGRYEDAANALREIVDLRNREGLPPDPIVHSDLANCLLASGQIEGAWAHWEQAETIAEKLGDSLALAHVRCGMGYAHQATGIFEKAIAAFESALSLFEMEGRAQQVFDMLACIGGVHVLSGNCAAACKAYRKAWQLARTAMRAIPGTAPSPCESPAISSARLVPVLNNLGGILYACRETKQAMEVLDEADRLLPPEFIDTPLETSMRHNRALALLAWGRRQDATCDLQKAIAGYESAGDMQRVAELSGHLCDLYRYENDWPAALGVNEKLIQLEKVHGVQVGAAGMSYTIEANRSLGPCSAPHEKWPSPNDAPLSIGDVYDEAPSRFSNDTRRPFVIFAPVMQGFTGPLFPRGATILASFLEDRGIPAIVIPLSHWIDPSEGAAAVQIRLDAVVKDVLVSLSPGAIGISIPFSFLYPDALKIALAVRKRQASCAVPIIAGGPHVTYWDVSCLEESPEIDMVVRGEGEWTTLELLRTLERRGDLNGVAGLTWRDATGTIHRNRGRHLGDILELPAIDFNLLPHAFCEKMDIFGLVSRGCRFRCHFCQEFRFWGGRVRYHAVDRIINEMQTLENEYDNRHIAIDDSMLDMGTPYFFELCGRLRKSSLSRPPVFLTRLDTVNEDGLRAMKGASISALKVGVESGSEKVLEKMKKGITPTRMAESLQLVHQAGVEAHAFVMVGHPGDTVQEAEKSIVFVDDLFEKELILSVDPAMYTPYPGTPCFSDPEKHGVTILTMDWDLWRRTNRPICRLDDFSASEIFHAFLKMLQLQSR